MYSCNRSNVVMSQWTVARLPLMIIYNSLIVIFIQWIRVMSYDCQVTI